MEIPRYFLDNLALSSKLDAALQRLNGRVDVDKVEVRKVASQFLETPGPGLIRPATGNAPCAGSGVTA